MSKELISQFKEFLKESGKSNSTMIAYSKDLEQLNEYTSKSLQELTSADIQDAISDMQSKFEFSPKTVSRKINSFRTFFKFLQDKGTLKDNPAEKIDHPKTTQNPPRVLSQMEYLALREISRSNIRLHSMIELILQTGLRIGELARLKVKHLKLQDTKGELHIEPYSTIPHRVIPLNTRAHQLLRMYTKDLSQEDEGYPLFPTREGNHIIIRNIRSSIDRAMAKAGIENACVNDLRNTFIVHQLRSGVAIDVVASTVGHRSKTTTQKYLELIEEPYSPNGESKLVDI